MPPRLGRKFASFERLPATGLSREEVLAAAGAMQAAEKPRWQAGYASGAFYHGDDGHVEFLNQVYGLHSQSNPLHRDLWPSAAKFEAEIVAMTARMLGADTAAAYDAERPQDRPLGQGDGRPDRPHVSSPMPMRMMASCQRLNVARRELGCGERSRQVTVRPGGSHVVR